jgi:hypothetical protein
VIIDFYFNQHSLDESDEMYASKKKSFDDTFFDLQSYLRSYTADHFAKSFSSFGYETLVETASWFFDSRLYFIVQANEDDTTEDNIFEDIIYDRLEDGPYYEGPNGGWIIMTRDGKYEYGRLDYRHEDHINVRILGNKNVDLEL